MDINTLYQEYLLSSGVSIDSRSIKPNQIFFALPGTKVKGRQYASEALNKGARLALVEDEGLAQNESKFFFTPDALLALQNLAIHHRNHLQIPIIGITGSAGKTTTKELISKVLSKKYVVSSTQGNLNNHIGVPLTLLGITPQTQIGIVEMGANHINEIEALCEIARPTHGLITSIGKAHLEGFGSLEGVILAKSELFRFLNKQNGVIFDNQDDALVFNVSKAFDMKKVFYADLIIGELIDASHQLKPRLASNKKEVFVNTSLPGKYNYSNLLSAATVGAYFGVSLQEIKIAFETFENSNNRSQLIKKGTNDYLMDAYNANPLSMSEAISSFADLVTDKNKILVLGEMREMGVDEMAEHKKIIELVQRFPWSMVCLIGDSFNFVDTSSHLKLFKDVDAFKSWESLQPFENAFILVKGSRGVALEKWISQSTTFDSTH